MKCEISDFRREIGENCALQGCYAAYSVIYHYSPRNCPEEGSSRIYEMNYNNLHDYTVHQCYQMFIVQLMHSNI